MSILPNSMNYLDENIIEENIIEDEDFYEYAYDFKNNQFLLDETGKHYYVYGNEAIKIWIYKTMITSRYKFSAYTDNYGTEVFDLVGEVISSRFKKEEIKRYITEAIMVNPFIISITKIDIEQKKDSAEIIVYYTTTFNNEMESVECNIPIM